MACPADQGLGLRNPMDRFDSYTGYCWPAGAMDLAYHSTKVKIEVRILCGLLSARVGFNSLLKRRELI